MPVHTPAFLVAIPVHSFALAWQIIAVLVTWWSVNTRNWAGFSSHKQIWQIIAQLAETGWFYKIKLSDESSVCFLGNASKWWYLCLLAQWHCKCKCECTAQSAKRWPCIEHVHTEINCLIGFQGWLPWKQFKFTCDLEFYFLQTNPHIEAILDHQGNM